MDTNFFEYDGIRTAWYRIGEGRPLVLLHGWGSSSNVMMPIAKQLQDIRSCYLIDFPGFGSSEEPSAAWDVDHYADLIETFILKHFNDSGDAPDLLVHSYGGRVALKLLTRPSISSKIGKVIITGGAGLKPRRKPVFYLKKYSAKLLKFPFLLLPGQLRERGLSKLRNSTLWKMLGSSDYRQLSGVMRQTFVKSVSEHLDHLLPKIEREILLIWGENDVATPIDQGIRMEKGLKNGALVKMDGAGHYAFLDKPKHFAAICRAYLEPKQ
jgi:pimeloyl-ACP methyl ester carboxylesterase